MSQHTSEVEHQNAICSAMGNNLGKAFSALYKEVVWVHAKWQEYRELFGSDSSRIQLLNRNASFFFKIVQDSLWEDVLLHIARLTDPARSFGRENLSIQMLPVLIEDEALRVEVQAQIARCMKAAEYAREHRNKRLAHRDLLHATAPEAEPLSGVSRTHIEEMLESLRGLMNLIDLQFRGTTVMYQNFIVNTGARRLLQVLRNAERTTASKPRRP